MNRISLISVFIPQHFSLEQLDPGNVMLINHISNTGTWLDTIYSSDIEEEQFYYRAPAIWPHIYKTFDKLKYFQKYRLNMSSKWIGLLMMDISSKINASARCTPAGEFDRGWGGGERERGGKICTDVGLSSY